MRPISSATRGRIATYLQRQNNYSIADSIIKATEILHFMDACGLDVVMPGWVPVNEDSPATNQRPPTSVRWEDLARSISIDTTDRKPWLPQ